MYKKFLFFAICVGFLAACNDNQSTADNTAQQNAEQVNEHKHDGHDHHGHDHGHDHAHDHHDHDHGSAAASDKHFGEKITANGTMSYAQLLGKMKQPGVDSVAAKVSGLVESVCQMKGCWMNITPEKTGQGEDMFVRFKDYGFFMPKDIAGRKVIMQGYAFREVTSVDELKHYAEDEGKPQAEIDAITEPVEELKFLASGVILLD